jgi:hypothetical protein
MFTIEDNLQKLNEAIGRYIETSRKTPQEALVKQGNKFAFILRQHLRTMSPAKGQSKSEALARLKSRGGIYIRPSVRIAVAAKYNSRTDVATRKAMLGKRGKASVKSGGKKLNIQALAVKREINLRESGRGFLAHSVPDAVGGYSQTSNRSGLILAQTGFSTDVDGASLVFRWKKPPGTQSDVTRGLSKTQQQDSMNSAIAETTEDIMIYLRRKDADEQAKIKA